MDADREIDALYDAWAEAYRREDIDTILSLVTDDYLLFAPAKSPLARRELRAPLAAALAAYDVIPSFEREEQIVSGDLAFERGWDVQTVRPRAGGEEHVQRQRVFLILQRGSDGVWRFARGIALPE